MEAKELRIGNLIIYRIKDDLDERKDWFEISKIDASDLDVLQAGLDYDYQPIPLTEEWLLKFGYWKLDHKDAHFVIKGHTIWKCNNLFMCEKNGIIIKSVHQLQNLYFALINNELIIK